MIRFSLLLLLAVSACAASAEDGVEPVPVVTGLEHPWSVAFLPDGGMLVTERPGRLRHVTADGTLTETPIAGVPDVFTGNQAGLFDVLLHPGFSDNRLVYLSHAAGTRSANATAISRGRLSADASRLEDVETIFTVSPKKSGRAHFGGRMLFLPDGTLLLTVGEGFSRRDEAQDPASQLGAVLRLDAEGHPAPGNPFAGQGDPAVWTIGHRNPQGIAIEPASGAVWMNEHGPEGGDEVNALEAGANYGWPERSGGRHYGGEAIPDHAEGDGFTGPLWDWTPSIAPSGMAFHSGRVFPDWAGDLFVGGLASEDLRRLEIEDGAITGETVLLDAFSERIRDVREGPDGSLYILTDSAEGGLYRLEPIAAD